MIAKKSFFLNLSALLLLGFHFSMPTGAHARGSGSIPGVDFDDLPMPECCDGAKACSADVNRDNRIDFKDIDVFLELIIENRIPSECTVKDRQCPDFGKTYYYGDINQDGHIDFNDIDGFVVALNGGGQCRS